MFHIASPVPGANSALTQDIPIVVVGTKLDLVRPATYH